MRNRLEYNMTNDPLTIAGRTFNSRLMIGTGKFPSAESLKAAIEASGAEIVTVALRRVDLSAPEKGSILSAIDPKRQLILPNTSGARTADEAVRLARMARAAGLKPWVKLELTPEPRYLLPDPIQTLEAAEILIKDGFVVLPYIQADPVLAKRLEELGAATVMPLGAPIGSNRGLRTRDLIKIIIEQSQRARRRRCGPRRPVARGGGHGTGRRRGAGEHGAGRRIGRRHDGEGVCDGHRRGPYGLPRRTRPPCATPPKPRRR